MKKKIIGIFIFTMFLTFVVEGQNDVDALRFSQINREGTARFMGAGGALGAVGADFSAISVNPAAIAVFKKHEFSFTPITVSILKTNSEYNGSNTPYSAFKYSIPNVGLVMKAPLSGEKWTGLYFGFGYNRLYDFNREYRISGRSKGISSIADDLAARAEGFDSNFRPDSYTESDFAYEAYLIDPVPGGALTYQSALQGVDLLQNRYQKITGGIDEMSFTVGANYADKFYLAGSIGVPFLRYNEHSTYTEQDDNHETLTLKELKITDDLNVRSTGINFKAGIIYQPVDFVRLGIAIQTPTYYGTVKDKFERIMFANSEDTSFASNTNEAKFQNDFNYTLTTPFRANIDVAFLILKRGFISLEYEIADYSSAVMMSRDYAFNDENDAIKDKYGLSHTIRVGGEISLTQNFLLRAGYNYITSPYKKKLNDGSMHVASAGFGFRFKYMFFDLAYSYTFSKEQYWLYNPELVSPAYNTYQKNRIYATVGIKF
ncbi:MAG: outer membrane protein transport protein [Bacteroidales bacterium]|jgi:long-subunit fatty acid transport protein|nr:outer membrane protein transport protein [Bacteroidales bacterium]